MIVLSSQNDVIYILYKNDFVYTVKLILDRQTWLSKVKTACPAECRVPVTNSTPAALG